MKPCHINKDEAMVTEERTKQKPDSQSSNKIFVSTDDMACFRINKEQVIFNKQGQDIQHGKKISAGTGNKNSN